MTAIWDEIVVSIIRAAKKTELSFLKTVSDFCHDDKTICENPDDEILKAIFALQIFGTNKLMDPVS